MPGEGDIEITWKANQTQLMAALLQQQAALQKSIDKAIELGNAGSKAGDNLGGMFEKGAQYAGQFLTTLTGIGSVMGGMMAVISQIKREYQDMVERQRSAAGTQVTLAGAQSEALRNLGKDASIKSGQELTERLRAMSVKTNVSEKSLTNAASAALSSRAELPATAALDAVQASAVLAPDLDEGGLTELSSAAMSLTRRGMTPQQALGFFLSVGKTSPIRNLRDTARNVAPAISKVNGFGGTLEESGALVSALATGMQDVTGEESGTAAIRLAEQLKERLPMMKSTRERIEAIQKDPKLRDKFFNPKGADFKVLDEAGKVRTAHFSPLELRAGAVVPTMELLRGEKAGTGTTTAFQQFLKEIPAPGKESAKVYDEEVARRKELPTNTTAGVTRAFDTGTERFEGGDLASGRAGATADGLAKFEKTMGVGALDRWADELETRFSSDPLETAAQILGKRAGIKYRKVEDAYDGKYTAEESGAILQAAKAMEEVAAQLRAENKAAKSVKVEVVAPKGVEARPAVGGLDRGGR